MLRVPNLVQSDLVFNERLTEFWVDIYTCTTSECGRMVYVYPEKDLRAYPGTIRGTEEWDSTYKIRTAVERDINHIKENLCLAGRRTQNEKTLQTGSNIMSTYEV